MGKSEKEKTSGGEGLSRYYTVSGTDNLVTTKLYPKSI